MCGIYGAINLRGEPIPDLPAGLGVMSSSPMRARTMPAHGRTSGHVRFGRRLSIIDPCPARHQPIRDGAGSWMTYNGEVYNYQVAPRLGPYLEAALAAGAQR